MLINKDLTQQKVTVYVTQTQIFAKIFVKNHGKWGIETYFKSYDFDIDEELVSSSIKEIIYLWGLKNPKVIVR